MTKQKPSSPEIKVSIEDIKTFLQEAELDRVQSEFFNRLFTIVIASLGLVTALAWDDVLRQIFAEFLGAESSMVQKIYYAVAITFLAAMISVLFGKLALRYSKRERKK